MSGSTWQEKADVIDPLERREEAEMGNDAKDDGSMSRISIADGKIDKLADAWHLLDLPDCGSDCGDNQARPTVIDSRSILAGVQGFESLSPHSSISLVCDFWLMPCLPVQNKLVFFYLKFRDK